MLEWLPVVSDNFTNPSGDTSKVKLLHVPQPSLQTRTVDTNGRTLGQVAFEEMDSYYNQMQLLEQNMQVIAEYDFDLSKVPQLQVPL